MTEVGTPKTDELAAQLQAAISLYRRRCHEEALPIFDRLMLEAPKDSEVYQDVVRYREKAEERLLAGEVPLEGIPYEVLDQVSRAHSARSVGDYEEEVRLLDIAIGTCHRANIHYPREWTVQLEEAREQLLRARQVKRVIEETQKMLQQARELSRDLKLPSAESCIDKAKVSFKVLGEDMPEDVSREIGELEQRIKVLQRAYRFLAEARDHLVQGTTPEEAVKLISEAYQRSSKALETLDFDEDVEAVKRKAAILLLEYRLPYEDPKGVERILRQLAIQSPDDREFYSILHRLKALQANRRFEEGWDQIQGHFTGQVSEINRRINSGVDEIVKSVRFWRWGSWMAFAVAVALIIFLSLSKQVQSVGLAEIVAAIAGLASPLIVRHLSQSMKELGDELDKARRDLESYSGDLQSRAGKLFESNLREYERLDRLEYNQTNHSSEVNQLG